MTHTRISQFRNNCVLVALKTVRPSLTDEDVIRVCKANGFKGHGMTRAAWLNAARTLNVHLEEEKNVKRHYATGEPTSAMLEKVPFDNGRGFNCVLNKRMTTHQFTRTYKEGTYLLQVKGHLLVINDGVVIDPNMARRHSRRQVRSAYRVTNAELAPRVRRLPRNPVFRFVRKPLSCARPGSRAFDTYQAVLELTELAAGKLGLSLDADMPIRLSDAETVGYTRKMLRRDLRRGNVELI